MEHTGKSEDQGLDRRSVLRRGAVLGGALVWTAPAVQTIAGPAFASGSPRCTAEVEASYTYYEGRVKKTGCVVYRFGDTTECCDCIEKLSALPLPVAILACAFGGKCTMVGKGTCAA